MTHYKTILSLRHYNPGQGLIYLNYLIYDGDNADMPYRIRSLNYVPKTGKSFLFKIKKNAVLLKFTVLTRDENRLKYISFTEQRCSRTISTNHGIAKPIAGFQSTRTPR